MDHSVFERHKNPLLLIARLLLALLFLIFGWDKATDFSGTVAFMTSIGAPMPTVATILAIVMELGAGVLIALGVCIRPVALLLALFVVGTVLIGHPFWTMQGDARLVHALFFYKNLSIVGGLLLLCVTGAGKYAIGRK